MASDNSQKETPENTATHSHSALAIWEKITGLVFGLIFVSVLLVINLLIAEPTPSQYATFKTILALAAAGIGGILAGTLHVEGSIQKWSLRAGGAIALFALVYFFSPAPTNGAQEQPDVTGIVKVGPGSTINISGYTIEQHERQLKERERQIRGELDQLHRRDTMILSLEKHRLERELSDVQTQLQNKTRSYQERIAFLENTIEALHKVTGKTEAPQLQAAIGALQRGETDKADMFFRQIEERERSSIERAAKAAFERGKIAEEKIDYRNAYRHYVRAVGLSPENPGYLETAGRMAGTLAKHHKEVEWKEKALDLYLRQGGENSAVVASDLKTHGDDNPSVASDSMNLGVAWQALGQYDKATGYYESALDTYKRSLGEDHPNTKRVAEYLKSVKAESK